MRSGQARPDADHEVAAREDLLAVQDIEDLVLHLPQHLSIFFPLPHVQGSLSIMARNGP
jgi:hypothetical protein